MHRSALIITLALGVGCGSETNLGGDLPVAPGSAAAPIERVTQTDVIVQVTMPKVDILWMIDNSCSMSNEQSDLTENFPHFMDYFVGSGLDYHVAVTSSDILRSNYSGSDGTLVIQNGIMVIDQETANPVDQFYDMANLGTSGASPEKGLGAIYKALEEKVDTTNLGFYRDDAALHTIVISDEADHTQDAIITLNEFIQWYDALKPEADQRTFSAIVDPHWGDDYMAVAKQIGGITWDITEGGWPQLLEELGLQASGFKREYFLSQLPVSDTIKVTVKGVEGNVYSFEPEVDWIYESSRNSITFIEYVPKPLAQVRIDYRVLAAEEGGLL